MAIQFIDPITVNDFRKIIPIYGASVTIVGKGEPGVGKSSVLSGVAEDLGDTWRKVGENHAADKYDYIYVDCAVRDVGDTVMSVPDVERTRLTQVVSDLFRLDSPKPKVIMLDEFMKTPKLLQAMWTRLMLERTVGDTPLPEGSIVFATSNNESDGVGDTMLAHAGNRVMLVKVRKPNANEWLTWAAENGVSTLIRAWVAMNPRSLASYLDGGQDDNPYIFNPSKRELSFVSPRSLAKSDIVVRNRDKVGERITESALAGVIGAAAAKDMRIFFKMERDLTPIKKVIDDPTGVPMPENKAALFLMVFNALDSIETQDDLTQFQMFIDRVKSAEIESIWFTMLMQSKRTVRIAKNNKRVMDWAKDNYELLM
jgi:hypothetical protein